jgi:hypothetical protein
MKSGSLYKRKPLTTFKTLFYFNFAILVFLACKSCNGGYLVGTTRVIKEFRFNCSYDELKEKLVKIYVKKKFRYYPDTLSAHEISIFPFYDLPLRINGEPCVLVYRFFGDEKQRENAEVSIVYFTQVHYKGKLENAQSLKKKEKEKYSRMLEDSLFCFIR